MSARVDELPAAVLPPGERSMRRRGIALFVCALVAAAGLGEYTWTQFGRDLLAVAAGVLTICAVLAAASVWYWQLSRPWQSTAEGRVVDRPRWVSQLFGIGLFVFPLEWAKKTQLFMPTQLGDLLWSPRIALVACLALTSAAIMYLLASRLAAIEARAATENGRSAVMDSAASFR